MRVILNQDINKLGKSGEVVNVKDGYARNFLFPRGLAFEANSSNMKRVEKLKEQKQQEVEKEKNLAQALADKLKGFSCTIAVEASDDDKLYGSVGGPEISSACQTEGMEIDKEDIILDEPIKKLGVYKVKVQLHPEVAEEIKLWVVRK